MAIATQALNLTQYALLSNDPLIQSVSFSLILAGDVFQDIPIDMAETLIANGVRFEGNLPSPNWTSLNSEGVTVSSSPTPYTEQIFLFRNYIDTDKLYVRDRNQIGNARETQTEAFLKGVAYDKNDKFFNNDHVAGDKNSFVGLKYRIDNGSKYGVRSENKIDAGGVDLSQSGMTATTANKFLEFLDQLLWSVDSPDGENVIVYGNEVFKRRFNFALRLMGTSGGLMTTQDQFNRTIMQYKGAIIRDPGYKSDQSTRIITNTEANTGVAGSSTFTSVYAVNTSADHFHGWSFEPINVQDMGLLNNGVTYRTLVDWSIGMINNSNRSIGRLYDIKMS
jgi:hypothetical protein